jgi:hypothetical protein
MNGDAALIEKERELAGKLRKAVATKKKSPGNRRTLVGLDGFIDEIVHVVDTRKDHTAYKRLEHMKEYANRIASFAGKSGNIEYVPQRIKIGGNGPIMANALSSLGVPVTYIGNLGYPDVHPVFQEMGKYVNIISLAEPCHTDAVEFLDGKIMIGKMAPIAEITWDRILEVVGIERLTEIMNTVSLLALVNWSMVVFMSDIWEKILEEVCPKLLRDRNRFAFFDLADPQKRELKDIRRMLSLVKRFSEFYKVIFGMNARESAQVARALGIECDTKSEGWVEKVCADIANELGIYCVVVHPVEFAVAAVGGAVYRQDGPHTSRPVITTGAGDHFNAAFCLGQTIDMDPQTSLLMGVCCSGHYVMTGRTPDLDELMKLMDNWREDPFGLMA